MSDKKWDVLKNWFFGIIANNIPEASKRFVLYELQSRAIIKDVNWNDDKDHWAITFEDMYNTLKD